MKMIIYSAFALLLPLSGLHATNLNLTENASTAFHGKFIFKLAEKFVKHCKAMLVKAGLDNETADEVVKVALEKRVEKKMANLKTIFGEVGVPKEKADEVLAKLGDMAEKKIDKIMEDIAAMPMVK